MKIFILTAFPVNEENFAFQNIKKSSLSDPYKRYKLVDNPEIADIIIFVEHHPANDPYFFQVLKHPLYKKYKKKCYLYHDNDIHLTFLPTISPSICKTSFNKRLHHPYHYIEQISSNSYVKHNSNKINEKRYLFCFLGASRTYPKVRGQIIKLFQGDKNVCDTSSSNSWELNDKERDIYFKNYAQILLQSKYILCPRGIGPSSYRQYESMKMGIAPVIISDEWIKPFGIDWNSCSIRIKEADVDKIDVILNDRENNYKQLGINAKKNYEKFMSFETQFHFLSEAASKLHSLRKEVSILDYLYQYLRFFEPFHFRNLLRYYKNRIIK